MLNLFTTVQYLPFIVTASVALLVYWKEIDSKFAFWLLSLVISYGTGMVAVVLFFLAYSSGYLDNGNEYMQIAIMAIIGLFWLLITILGIRSLAKKYKTTNK